MGAGAAAAAAAGQPRVGQSGVGIQDRLKSAVTNSESVCCSHRQQYPITPMTECPAVCLNLIGRPRVSRAGLVCFIDSHPILQSKQIRSPRHYTK